MRADHVSVGLQLAARHKSIEGKRWNSQNGQKRRTFRCSRDSSDDFAICSRPPESQLRSQSVLKTRRAEGSVPITQRKSVLTCESHSPPISNTDPSVDTWRRNPVASFALN
ncbi:hypothetical protein CEXT_105781 [Caerostris extrusa]|uniref:Uncharacterized protein n=1 Tax=Caerostris extrusa TaxID=172846 RepID=A0AAV4P7C2_CAEEX|nr:hypothetical protein CEXT_105781 [Caerostris extrusa]